MQILGLYFGISRNILKTLKEFHNAQLFFPIVLALEREGFISTPDHISIFPPFYSVDRCATTPQLLAQSFCEDQGSYLVADPKNVRELSIYLVDSSDIPSISALARNMAISFPHITYLNLCFERRCDIVSFLIVINVYNRTNGICIIFLAISEDKRRFLLFLQFEWRKHLWLVTGKYLIEVSSIWYPTGNCCSVIGVFCGPWSYSPS